MMIMRREMIRNSPDKNIVAASLSIARDGPPSPELLLVGLRNISIADIGMYHIANFFQELKTCSLVKNRKIKVKDIVPNP